MAPYSSNTLLIYVTIPAFHQYCCSCFDWPVSLKHFFNQQTRNRNLLRIWYSCSGSTRSLCSKLNIFQCIQHLLGNIMNGISGTTSLAIMVHHNILHHIIASWWVGRTALTTLAGIAYCTKRRYCFLNLCNSLYFFFASLIYTRITQCRCHNLPQTEPCSHLCAVSAESRCICM